MKSFVGYISLAILSLQLVQAADIEYSVIAFPKEQQSVAVVVGGQAYPLAPSTDHANIFKGNAPAAEQYQYQLGDALETPIRKQQQGIVSTGNEFFNRSQTIFDIPAIPQAYNPIYHPLMSNMNRSNEIATIILNTNVTGFNEIIANPMGDFNWTEVNSMAYISNKEVFNFAMGGIKNSGKSTKEFAKQSYKIKLNEFTQKTDKKQLLFGRSTIKLRAHETDPTFVREKLLMDCLGASGVATLQGSYARLYVNNEPFGLYLMIDDSTTNFINIAMRGGNQKYQYTGPTYKGNAMTPQEEGNLAYIDDNAASYSETIYKLEDEGNLKKTMTKATEMDPLIKFMKDLATVNPTAATDENNKGNIEKIVNPQHTMIHLALSYLTGSWDGVWHQASNYYVTQETNENLWNLISYDFDETFGTGAPRWMATTPYSNFSRPDSKRPLVDAFIKSPYYAAEFEKVLQTLVKRYFKPSVMTPRLQAMANMLREDVEWDLSIEPKSPGMKTQWTLWNFDNNMLQTDGESMGVAEWVEARSKSLQQLYNFTEEDDLPVLGPYTSENNWDPNNYEDDSKDANGNDIKANNEKNASGASKQGIASIAVTMAIALGVSQLL